MSMKAAGTRVLQAMATLFLEFVLVGFAHAFVIVSPASHRLRLDYSNRSDGLLSRRIRTPLRG